VSDTTTLETPQTWGEAIAAAPNPFAIAASRYVRAPIAFVREVLGAQPDPWQLEALRALPGMVKRQCLRCAYWFAVKAEAAETTATCLDCAPSQTRAR
jgi:hypothetical protein